MTIYRQIALIGTLASILVLSSLQSLSAKEEENDAPHEVTSAPVTQETWGDNLVKDKGLIPTGSFLAIYFRTSQPQQIIYTETVPKIAINYSRDEFQNIHSKDFSAYWVGDFEFRTDDIREFHLSQSWAKTRILVDRKIIYDGGTSQIIPVRFSPGRHRIEVQYENNWHTVGYSMKVLPAQDSQVPPPPPPNKTSAIWFVGVYESSNRGGEITLNIKPAKTPIYLYLSSYDPISWKIELQQGARLAGVFYSSHQPGVEIEIADPTTPKIQMPDGRLPRIYNLQPECSDRGGISHCDPPLYQGDKLKTAVESLTGGHPPNGFSGKYSLSTMEVPERYLSEDDYIKMHYESRDLDKGYLKRKLISVFEKMIKSW